MGQTGKRVQNRELELIAKAPDGAEARLFPMLFAQQDSCQRTHSYEIIETSVCGGSIKCQDVDTVWLCVNMNLSFPHASARDCQIGRVGSR